MNSMPHCEMERPHIINQKMNGQLLNLEEELDIEEGQTLGSGMLGHLVDGNVSILLLKNKNRPDTACLKECHRQYHQCHQ